MADDGVVERLVIVLGVDVDRKSFDDAKKAASGLAAAILAAGAALVGLVAHTAAAGDEVLSTARKVQVSTVALTEFYHVADDLGASAEGVVGAFRFLNRSIADARDGSEETRKAFRAVGLSMDDLRDLPVEEVLTRAADGFTRLGSDAKRTQLAMKLFGRGGVELLPVLAAGSDEIRRLRGEAHELGAVWLDTDAEAADALNDSIGRLTKRVTGLGRRIGIDLVPYVQDIVDSMEAWWSANNRAILQHVDRFATDAGRAFAALNTPLGATVGLFVALAGATEALKIAETVPVVSSLMEKLAPIGKYAAGAALLYLAFDDFRTAAEGGDSAVGMLAEKMGVGGEFDLAARNTKSLLDEFAISAPQIFNDLAAAIDTVYDAIVALGTAIDAYIPDWLRDAWASGVKLQAFGATGGISPFASPPRQLLASLGNRTGGAVEGFRAFNATSAAATTPLAQEATRALRIDALSRAFGLPFGQASDTERSALQGIIRQEMGATVNVYLQGDRLAPGDAQSIQRATTGALLDAADQIR